MGIFSGLAKTLTSGDFYAGAATTISANIDRDRAEQKEKIQKLVDKTFDDGKILRDKNREKKKRTKEQYENTLRLFGSDPNVGAVADAMARLSPTQYAETVKSIQSAMATAQARGTGADLRSLGVITTDPADRQASADVAGLGITLPQAQIQKFTGTTDDVVKRVMGTLENTDAGVNPEEKETLKKSFARRIGGLSSEEQLNEARKTAAQQLGISVEQLTALQTGEGYTGMAGPVAGINLGIADPAAVTEAKLAEVTFRLNSAQLTKAQEEAKKAIASRELGEKITERRDPMTGVRRPMSGYEFAALSDLATARAERDKTNAETLALGNVNNWSTTKINRLQRNLLQGVTAALGLDMRVFQFNNDDQGRPTTITSKADVMSRENALLALSGHVTTNLYESNRQANEGTVMDVIVTGRRPADFAKVVIDLYENNQEESGEFVRNIIERLNARGNNVGNTLISDIRKLLPITRASADLDPEGKLPNIIPGNQVVAEEGFNPDVLERTELVRRPQQPLAPALAPATDFRGMPIEDIGTAITDRYNYYAGLTTPPNQTRINRAILANFIDKRGRGKLMGYDVEDATAIMRRFDAIQAEANEGVAYDDQQGVMVTPALVQRLITDVVPEDKTATPKRKTEREPLTPEKMKQNWASAVGASTQLSNDPSSNTYAKQRNGFVAYLVRNNVKLSEAKNLWERYSAAGRGKEIMFSQASVDDFVKNQ